MSAFPAGLPLELDRDTRVTAGGRGLMGGEPRRLLRLTAAGAAAVERLQAIGTGGDAATTRLARRLVDAGLAHPQPAPGERAGVTIVVAVRDRAAQLDACLDAAGGPALVVDDGSRDAPAVAEICARHGARLIRRDVPGGPAAARNDGLAAVDTQFVAFVDSDCIPDPLWLERLIGHFADPRVAAVAPRITAVSTDRGPVGRFSVARSPIDLGARPARVVPMGRVSYVPTATLIVRRAALRSGFDERLRFGEDVDLVWRLHAAGWTVRFDPRVRVRHQEPVRWRDLVRRHYRYGTGAARLARRHPKRLAPLVIEPWTTAIAACVLVRRTPLGAAILATRALRAKGRAPIGPGTAAAWSLQAAWQTTIAAGHAATMLAPAALVAAAATARGRRAGLTLLLAPPLVEWARCRPKLDPVRFAALAIADDMAYGLGVWRGCISERTLGPLTPAIRSNTRV